MNDQQIEQFAALAYGTAFVAAEAYYAKHKTKPTGEGALIACLKYWTKKEMPEALQDAREAAECGMNSLALMTFKASMMQAGIEAAMEAEAPPTWETPADHATLTTEEFRERIRRQANGLPETAVLGASRANPCTVRKPTDRGFYPPNC